MKWITATDLGRWAVTKAAEGSLPYLVSSLIRASSPSASSFRFPSGDSAQIPGYDGRLEAEGFAPYVPEGKSVWEFGTGEKYKDKANKDYEKRTKEPGAATPAETTLVFVTPRTWSRPDLDEWVKEKKEQGFWKDIRVIDAVALEDWLERSPAVAAKLARELLSIMPAIGAQSTEEFWDECISRFGPPITEAVVLAGREEQSKTLLQQLQGAPGPYLWQGDSLDEVIAFAIACVHSADDETRKFLDSRILVVDTEEALKQLANRRDIIVFARSGALNLPGLLGKRSPAIVPVGSEQLNRREANVLKRPRYDQMAEALKTMGMEEADAQVLARKCGSSVTVLARIIPSSITRNPEWADHTQLVPALLAGGWSFRSDADQQAVHELAVRKDYATYEKELLPYLKMTDSPLEKEADVWKIRAPLDVFIQLGCLIGNDDFQRFEKVVKSVFGEHDPALELSGTERFYAAFSGKQLAHSSWLRTGLATTLLLIAVFHDQAKVDLSGTTPEAFVSGIVAAIPGLDIDYRTLASLYGVLPLIAEAAPRPLLQALGRLLEGEGERIKGIFQDKEDAFYSSSPHTGLLWALEVLAWDPKYLAEATLTLAQLARVDPGGKLVNRPLNSLREIFVAWHPSTNANLTQRLAALDYITKHEPQIAWELLVKLLPEYHSSASSTAKPRYRDAGASEREVVTYPLLAKSYQEIITRVLNLIGEDASRWKTLIRQVSNFSPDDRARVSDLLEKYSVRVSGTNQQEVWEALRAEVSRHRRFKDAQWAMQEQDLKRLDDIVARLQPAEVTVQVSWLFDEYHPNLPGTGDEEDEWQRITSARRDAVSRIFRDEGIPGIMKLANSAKLPWFVGYALSEAVDDVAVVEEAVKASLLNNPEPGQFAIALSSAANFKFKELWRACVEQNFRGGMWTARQVGLLMRDWNDESSTWRFAEALGSDVEKSYWAVTIPRPIKVDEPDWEYSIGKYLQYGRAVAAIDAVWHPASAISPELLLTLLDAAVPEMNADPGRLSSHLGYEIQSIFAELRKRADVPAIEIARREYAYLPILEAYEHQPLVIHTLLSDDPELFMSLVRDAKPSSGRDEEITDEGRARAMAAYKLISDFHTLPGAKGAEIDADQLNAWIKRVRELAVESDRSAITDELIGHVLAYAPEDPADGAWPHRVIRDVIDSLASDHVDQGVMVERFNMRGFTVREPYDGGSQERVLAARMREWAKIAVAWPRTAKLLEEIAKDWERHADLQDTRARQDEMRFD
jgi:hypothetical protein